jgi:hypothetical protein
MTVKEEKCSVEEAAASYALDRERAYQKLRCGAHADREDVTLSFTFPDDGSTPVTRGVPWAKTSEATKTTVARSLPSLGHLVALIDFTSVWLFP